MLQSKKFKNRTDQPRYVKGSIDLNEGDHTIDDPIMFGRYRNLCSAINENTISSYPVEINLFEDQLRISLKKWRTFKATAGWVHVHYNYAHFIPILVRNGFSLHRTDGNFIVLSIWLNQGESKLPLAGTHIAGSCGIVVRLNKETEKKQILIIREKFRRNWWEFPGGAVELGDYFVDTACKEVKEEVGLDVKPIGFLGCWDELNSRFGKNNVYMGFVCQQVNEEDEFQLNEEEILEAMWVDLDIFKEASLDTLFNGFPLSGTTLHFSQTYAKNNQLGPLTERSKEPGGAMSGKGWFYFVG